jgi:hypothetical protein
MSLSHILTLRGNFFFQTAFTLKFGESNNPQCVKSEQFLPGKKSMTMTVLPDYVIEEQLQSMALNLGNTVKISTLTTSVQAKLEPMSPAASCHLPL